MKKNFCIICKKFIKGLTFIDLDLEFCEECYSFEKEAVRQQLLRKKERSKERKNNVLLVISNLWKTFQHNL